MPSPLALLTTEEVAKLLRVHPQHVYRLLKKGLPARRVGSEWRFDRGEVLSWSKPGRAARQVEPEASPGLASTGTAVSQGAPPLIAANGDQVGAILLRLLRESGTVIGFVQADKEAGFRMLGEGSVFASGSHAGGFPTHAGGSGSPASTWSPARSGWWRGGVHPGQRTSGRAGSPPGPRPPASGSTWTRRWPPRASTPARWVAGP